MTKFYASVLITSFIYFCFVSLYFLQNPNVVLVLVVGGGRVDDGVGKLPVPGRPTNLDYGRARA